MPFIVTTLKEQRDMPVHVLKERTYLDAEGKATADEAQAVSLLGIENDELSQEQALAAGLIKSVKAHEEVAAEMLYYNASGEQVAAGSPDVAAQYLDNDLNRPDVAAAAAKADKQAVKVVDNGDEAPSAPAPTKADLLARAEELGLEGFNARSRNAAIAAAIAAAE